MSNSSDKMNNNMKRQKQFVNRLLVSGLLPNSGAPNFENEINEDLRKFRSSNPNIKHQLSRNSPFWNTYIKDVRERFPSETKPVTHLRIPKPSEMVGKQREHYEKGIKEIKKAIAAAKGKQYKPPSGLKGEKKAYEDFKKWLKSLNNEEKPTHKKITRSAPLKRRSASFPKPTARSMSLACPTKTKSKMSAKTRAAKEIRDRAIKHARSKKMTDAEKEKVRAILKKLLKKKHAKKSV